MRKMLCIVLTAIIVMSLVTANIFAAKTYTCPGCFTSNSAIRVCFGEMLSDLSEILNCPYRNQTVLGNLHRGNCMLVRNYCRTYYYCSTCNATYFSYDYHLCNVTHTSVDGVETISQNVCSTFIDLNSNADELQSISFKQYYDLVLSGNYGGELK